MKFLSCWVLAGTLFVIPLARAQSGGRPVESATESEAYRQAIDAAISEYDLGHYSEAREQFRRAHTLFPNARTLRGLGITEFELRDYNEAKAFLEQSLASRVKPLDASQRADTASLLQRTRGYLGAVRLRMSPPTASVSVDGQEAALDANQTVSLDVGDHWFEFQAPGHARLRRRVRVDGGQDQLVSVELLELESQSRARPTAEHGPGGSPIEPERAPSGPPLYKRWWLWTAVGAVVVGGAVASALLLTRRTEVREEPFRTDNTPPGSGIVLPAVMQ